jgi:PAS domain S-box-containing protein
MSHIGQELAAPANGADEIEQVLLGLADGSYVLSTPDGAVAECGVGVVALLGTPAEALAGRRTAEALLAGADAESRAAFERLLYGDGAAAHVFRIATAAGARRALRFVVIAVPLALGWEFTSLLTELGSRDAGTWHPEALRLRHGRALEAIEGICGGGAQPEPGARLAGILIVVRDVDAPPLTREDVGRRMAEHRAAARDAVAEAARRADTATGRLQDDAGDASDSGGLEDLVERARVLRERVEEAERDAVAASSDRDHALAQLAAAQAELAEQQDARGESALLHGQITALRGELEAAQRELELARGEELAGAIAERDTLTEELAAVRAELEGTQTQLRGVQIELDGVKGQLEAVRGELAHTRAAIRAEFAVVEPDPGPGPAGTGAPSPADGLALPPAVPGEAVALIGLDGTFKRLDDAFCSLLGCREEELRAARWPSVIDRENIAAHQEIARALRAGEIDSAPVETVYMHAQGLLVPIAGTVTMHRAAGAGPATHYLFRADVRRTSG